MVRLLALTVLLSTALAQAQPRGQSSQNQLDGSQALFTVLAAINAAGYDADVDSTANSPVRRQVRDALAQKHLESVEALKKFFAKHRKDDPEAELSQYISFGLSIDGPPDFKYWWTPEELPPDVQKLDGLNELIARFYQEAGIQSLWNRAQPEFDRTIASYHSGVAQALLEANAYLRNPTSGFRGRYFQIYIDLLGAPNEVQTRSYKDEYFVVITPSAEPQIDQIRHAYLHYLLDPLSLRYNEQLERIKALADFAQPAPALPDAYKNDFLLLATECVIKAVESRLAPRANRQALVDQALREGYVLTPGLADGLVAYEKQEQSLRNYFPDLLGQIDLAREDKRLDKVTFVQEAAVKKAPHAAPPPEPVLTGAARTLAEAEDLYTKRDLENARQRYLKVLEEPGGNSLHGKAYYGLARIAALQRDPGLAEKLFQKTVEMAPDGETTSWAYLYLGRLADAAGDRSQAEKNYRAALAVDGAPASVKAAAEKGIAQPFQKR
ncbi:MAG TPA: tetratricopeptide repeat protein [Bryobacteraceae bacterium]|nr:tetratricopeptide repeat protein [Bryobacteraceae bacterium]